MRRFELLVQGFRWPLAISTLENFEACFVQVALKPLAANRADDGIGTSQQRRRVLARTLPARLCHCPQFPDALVVEILRSDFEEGANLEFSVFLLPTINSPTDFTVAELARFSLDVQTFATLPGNSAVQLESRNWDGCLQVAMLQPLYTVWPTLRGRWRMAQSYRVANVLAREECVETIFSFLVPMKYMTLRCAEMHKWLDKRNTAARREEKRRKKRSAENAAQFLLSPKARATPDSPAKASTKAQALAAAAALGELSMQQEIAMVRPPRYAH